MDCLGQKLLLEESFTLGSCLAFPWKCFQNKEEHCQKLNNKFMTSEVMNFACSDSCENGITRGQEPCLQKERANCLLQSILDFTAMNQYFQSIK